MFGAPAWFYSLCASSLTQFPCDIVSFKLLQWPYFSSYCICCHDPLRFCGSSSLCQCAVEKWDMTPYKDRFPNYWSSKISCWSPTLCHLRVYHCSDFLVSLQSFGFVGSAIHLHPCLLSGWSSCWSDVVLTIGKLIPQLSVEEFTLPFLNLSGCHLVTHVANLVIQKERLIEA
jgi:hypothetical protein